ncbi:MAG: redoxin domain-containing protein [Alphaproteobacteria bacterium]|nr:redoxin domain-containing protein [Alphaproteobacteria bacterium]
MPYRPTQQDGSGQKKPRNPYVRTSTLSSPRNKGLFATAVLGFVLLILLSTGIKRALFSDNPLAFVSATPKQIEDSLKYTNKLSSLVFIFDSKCLPCKRQLSSFESLYANVRSGELNMVLISFDESPDTAADFLRLHKLPAEIVPFYAEPENREPLKALLKSYGAQMNGVPFIGLFNKQGALMDQYTPVVSAQQIRSVFSVLTIRN